ncbi:PilW family protein [Pseudothauera nasutitermitis]|uniref:PilW family protein n=1 Tax=Pseudothauera nasutitermitis TaxID=2565930 RepID=UPI001454E24F|nr:PilW family protein [Pseudothauera nasutitermitis]
MPAIQASQRGLTIVELMIGLLLGVLLLGGVLYVYLGSSQTYRSTEALSRVQESGRFAMDFLSSDLRQAGYKGVCSRDTEVVSHLNTGGTGYTAEKFELDEGIRGWNGGNGGYALTGYRAGSDTLLLKHAAAPAGVSIADDDIPTSAEEINLTASSGIPAGQIVLISDSEGCDLFQNSAQSSASVLARQGGAGEGTEEEGSGEEGEAEETALEPGNRSGSPLSHDYTGDTDVHLFRSAIYYIGDGAGGLPALRRLRFDRGAPIGEELVEGIVDMQICYGVDTDQDSDADNYVAAGAVADWDEVVAARVTLVAISPESNVATGAPTVSFADCDGTVLTRDSTHYPALGELRLARVFTSTIALRNKLP